MKKIISILLLLALSLSVMAKPQTIKLAGSTTVLPLAQMWAEAYMDANKDTNISVSGGGSGTGLSMLLNDSCKIGMASRAANKKEIDAARQKNSKLVAHKIALDGIALIVNKKNSVSKLTISQISSIYTGKVKSWKDFGGEGGISVIGRDSSSGTYGSFQELALGGKNYASSMMSQPSNQAIVGMVSKTPSAIGYVGHAYAVEAEKKGTVKIISVSKSGTDYISPSDSNVKSGKYPLSRALYFYTVGSPTGNTQKFIKWCLSDGQKYVDQVGYVSIK